MQITVDKKELNKVLGRCAAAANKKGGALLPALSCLRLEARKGSLIVDGTDLQIRVRGVAAAEVTEPGVVLVHAGDVTDAAGTMPDGAIVLRTEKKGESENLVIAHATARRKHTLPTSDPEGYPNLDKLQAPSPVAFPAPLLERVISSSAYCVATDDTRQSLACALLEVDGKAARMVATDGHRLSHAEVVLEGNEETLNVLIPRKAVGEIKRMCSEDESGTISLGWSEDKKRLIIAAGTYRASLALSEYQFPPYQHVIPDESTGERVTADHEDLVGALKACSLRDRQKPLAITFTAEGIKVHAEGDGKESDDLVVTEGYAGKPVTVGMNAQYILEALAAVPDGKVELAFQGELDPLVVRGSDSSTIFGVVMPMRV